MYIGTGKFQLKIRLVIGCFEARYLSISKFETRETLCIYRLLYISRFYLFVLYLFVCKRVKFNFWTEHYAVNNEISAQGYGLFFS